MYLVVGLGNPGGKYKGTRHNMEFEVIDALAQMYRISVNRIKFKGMSGELRIGMEKVILLKPTTYMNLSGESVVEAVNYYNIPNENIIIIHDDVSLEVGRIRIRSKGSSGGQNGVKNVIHHLNTEAFMRLKIGVGKPERDMVAHVLGKFPKDENQVINMTIEAAGNAVETIIKEGPETAMNKFNCFKAEI